jgi:O-antigen/teichoic acid export membrane protein
VLGIITAASVTLSLIYFLFPETVIKIFFTSQYLTAAPYIGLFGLFQAIYAIMNAYVTFFIAIGKTKYAAQSIIAAVLQVILICIFHNSLKEVILVSTLICAVFSIYYTVCTVRLAYSTNKLR